MVAAPTLGVCYYPEHWDEALWAEDAKRMADVGIKKVRIGEFAWGVIEPARGDFHWDWLDRAIETLAAEGLEIILGTPTATPPKWLIDAHPEILAYDEQGRPRRFGSRRHYCFSSPVYRKETARIVTAMAERYGKHDAVTAWQTDNEYGCHNTTRSWSPAAEAAFRTWLKERYKTADALNEAWGTVFWSQQYRSFDQVDLPNLTVTEPNPSHVLDFYRFSSDQVVSYNRLQTNILRKLSPGRDIIHNFMGFYVEFDHFKVGDNIDVASWDSYPLGFLDQGPFPADDKQRYMRQGHPDLAAFHHDLYRGCGNSRWAVMEQQPGPVNWAPNNPAPLRGMVRLWSHEAIAHGAEFVSYFRWRQAPFAQEQMHAGLLRPDNEPAPAYAEAKRTAEEINKTPASKTEQADVALIFSYDAQWIFETHSQGAGWSYQKLCYEWYAALRIFGLNVDFVPPGRSLDGYKLIVAPSLPYVSNDALAALKKATGQILLGPRSGSKTESLQIPPNLAPGSLQELIPVKIIRSESFPEFYTEQISIDKAQVTAGVWFDHVETELAPIATTQNGDGALYRQNNFWLLTTVPRLDFLAALMSSIAVEAGVNLTPLPPDLRMRRKGDQVFVFNYGPAPVEAPEWLREKNGDMLPPAAVRWLQQAKH